MKSAYMICVLLCITIGSLVLANGVQMTNKTQASNKSVPLLNSAAKTDNEINATTVLPDINSTPIISPNSSTTTSTNTTTSTTTAVPTKSTITTTTVSPPTTGINVTTSSTTISTSTITVRTTAVPTAPPSPSEHRHFDGLSFFGGFILATCLMAIAVFSWKFYRQCNERNYRTL